jgi:hypothetical protein
MSANVDHRHVTTIVRQLYRTQNKLFRTYVTKDPQNVTKKHITLIYRILKRKNEINTVHMFAEKRTIYLHLILKAPVIYAQAISSASAMAILRCVYIQPSQSTKFMVGY